MPAAMPYELQLQRLEAWLAAQEAWERQVPTRSPAAMLKALNDRHSAIGATVEAITGRVMGDNARGRLEFGETSLVHWN